MGTTKEEDKNYEWLTPPWVLKALGRFDLDPCAPVTRPWEMAAKHYTIIDDGLIQPWEGRAWVNPPYGKYAQTWAAKLHEHGNGILLIPARTASPWFHREVYKKGDAILYLEDRLWYYDIYGVEANGNAGHDSVLVAYGRKNINSLADSGIKGHMDLLTAIPVIIIKVSPSWKSVVTIALDRRGGEADTQQIYEIIEAIADDKVKHNPHWKEKVREKLQKHFTRIRRGVYSTNES